MLCAPHLARSRYPALCIAPSHVLFLFLCCRFAPCITCGIVFPVSRVAVCVPHHVLLCVPYIVPGTTKVAISQEAETWLASAFTVATNAVVGVNAS